jgi:hypothetical protein
MIAYIDIKKGLATTANSAICHAIHANPLDWKTEKAVGTLARLRTLKELKEMIKIAQGEMADNRHCSLADHQARGTFSAFRANERRGYWRVEFTD